MSLGEEGNRPCIKNFPDDLPLLLRTFPELSVGAIPSVFEKTQLGGFVVFKLSKKIPYQKFTEGVLVMTVMDAIRNRHSVRSYLPVPVEKEKLQQILEAGRLAPSARNTQAWKFVMVTDPETIKALGPACCGQSFIEKAPAFLAVCTTEPSTMACGQPARTIDGAIAMSFMILEAEELGLGTCWIGAFDNEEVKKVLGIPDSYDVVAVTPIGYPEKDTPARPRKGADEVICWEKF